MRANMHAPGVLTEDVTTRWGTYARGIDVIVLLDAETEYVVCVASIAHKQINARVPKSFVRVAS